jgi:hypothetical protein
MVYEDLQKSFSSKLRRKIVAPKSQPRTELANIQTRLVQSGKS